MAHAAERQPLLPPRALLAPVPPPRDLNHVSGAKLYWIFAVVWTTVFLGALDSTIVATLQQPIGDYFQQSHIASYIGTSYMLSGCCFTPLYGRLSDILGRKGAMLLALTIFTTGTLLCGIAPSMKALIAARAIAGMGGGGIFTVSSIVATDLIPLRNRGLIQGVSNTIFGVGAGLGGPIGGYISDNFGWKYAFLVQVPFLVASAILIAIHVNIILPEAPLTLNQKLKKIDWLGSLTLVLFVSSFLAGFSLKATKDLAWGDTRVLGPISFSGLALSAFIFVEAKVSPAPVMPMRLLLSRTPLAVSLTNFFGSIVSFSILYNVPLYFMAVRLQTASEAGQHLVPNAIALSLGSFGAGWIMQKTGKYWFLTVASTSLSLLGSTLVALWDRKRTSEGEFWFDITFNGLGIASTVTSTLIAITACVAREDMAVATGIMYLFRTTGQVLGVSLSGTIFQAVLVAKLRETMPGPDKNAIIEMIRHDAGLVRSLGGAQREAAVSSFAQALKVVFICQASLAVLSVICALPIEERPLPGSHEEHDEGHRRRENRNVITEDNRDTGIRGST
ncbi:hypothetical protein M408DRAFT_330032 [Serendipita vermifera MAFF 305830]|uniref:Major facilitator superfamily (MFS) profile domain-containing protein n=1 Tax=Serendipita vermifera MAFF 305830 TaxID=933852 RepID=A0A0C3ASU4_SERVB|nr:hypothetical protein M408DRAFT_330032 [Serendipita vermifera MAFF 305830]